MFLHLAEEARNVEVEVGSAPGNRIAQSSSGDSYGERSTDTE